MHTDKPEMTFAAYYKKLNELPAELRNRIMTRLGFNSLVTFYNKLNKDNWTLLEREAVNLIVEEFHQELSKIEKPCL